MYLATLAALGALCCGVPSALWSYESGPEELPDQDPVVALVLTEAQSLYPDPAQPFGDYLVHAQARIDRGLDLAGAAASAQKALVLHPDSPHAAALLVQASGASGGQAGVDLARAQALLKALEAQGELRGDPLLLTQGYLAFGEGDLLGASAALQGVKESSWTSKRLALELALAQGKLGQAAVIAAEFSEHFETDASTCRVGMEQAIAAGQLSGAEALANDCLAEGAQDPRLHARLAELADWTGRPAVAASRYAAAGMATQAVAVQWQEGILPLNSARAQLRGDSAGEREQRCWMALKEGDSAAALVESEGLSGAARGAALLQSGAPAQQVLDALGPLDAAEHVIAALATKDTDQELEHWQAALSPWPANPELLTLWLLGGGAGTQGALMDHLEALEPNAFFGARAVPKRSAPIWVLLPEVPAEPSCGASDPCRILMGDWEALQQPVFKALVSLAEGDVKGAKTILAQVPQSQRTDSWTLANAQLDLASDEATRAQAALVPLLQIPGAKRILAQAVAHRGREETALATLGGLLKDQPQDQRLWEICWAISSEQGPEDLDSDPLAQ